MNLFHYKIKVHDTSPPSTPSPQIGGACNINIRSGSKRVCPAGVVISLVVIFFFWFLVFFSIFFHFFFFHLFRETLLVIIQPSYPGGVTEVGRRPGGCGVPVVLLRRGRGGDALSHKSSDPRAQQSITINPWALMNIYAICIIHTVAVILFAGGLPSATLRVRDDPPGFFFPLQLHVMDVGAVWVVCLLPNNNNSIRLQRKPITGRGSCFRTSLENHSRHIPLPTPQPT